MIRRLFLAGCLVPTLACHALLSADFDDFQPQTGSPSQNDDSDGGIGGGDVAAEEEEGGKTATHDEGSAVVGEATRDAGLNGRPTDAGPPKPTVSNAVVNGDFEAGKTAWSGWQDLTIGKAACEVKESLSAVAGRVASLEPRSTALDNDPCSISQSVTIQNAAKVTLTFMLKGKDAERATFLEVHLGLDKVFSEAAPPPADGFVAKRVNVTAFAGQTRALSFKAITTALIGESVEIDRVAIVVE